MINANVKTTTLRLKKGFEQRLKRGHPWVFSNELQELPKEIENGSLVQVADSGGAPLGVGLYNRNSLISIRLLATAPPINAVSTAAATTPLDPETPAFWNAIVGRAKAYRESLGVASKSHRIIHGEADSLSGLIVDRYFLGNGTSFFVFQIYALGIEKNLKPILEAFAQVYTSEWNPKRVILRRDSKMRVREGLETQPPELLVPGEDFSKVEILLRAGAPKLKINLLQGQKTGFFLDQQENIRFAQSVLASYRPGNGGLPSKSKEIAILDLFSYVGAWGIALAQTFQKNQYHARIDFCDASKEALALAQENAKNYEFPCETHELDLLSDALPVKTYDVVVLDPPALIKNKKDIPQGKHAYLKLNTLALEKLKPGGVFLTFSCSQLLDEEEWKSTIQKATTRAGHPILWAGSGSQAIDHPLSLGFPEGKYLKMLMGISTKSL